MFRDLTRLSAAGIPTIALVFGNSTAGGAYIPGMSDHVVMIKERSKVFLGRPAAGEDGHRRGVRRRVARRRRDARPHLGSGRLLRRRRARRDPHRPPDRGAAELAQAGPGARGRVDRAAVRRRGAARHRARRPAHPVRPARRDRPHRRRLGVRRVQAALRRRRWSPAGRRCTATRSASWPTRAACCSARSRRRPPSSSSWPTGPTRHCCSCTTPPATWSARSTRRAGSSSTAR